MGASSMALRSTIHKCELSIADIDRSHYADYALTLARHPSETEERMMIRLLAFALLAEEGLVFAGDLSSAEEPAIWSLDLTGAIKSWVEVGLPDEKLLRRACGRARLVHVFAYGGARAELWWKAQANALARCDNLSIHVIDAITSKAMTGMAQRNMRLSCNIHEQSIWFGDDSNHVTFELDTRQKSSVTN